MHPRPDSLGNTLMVRDLGNSVPYVDGLALQEACAEERRADNAPDTLLLLEHTPVFTLGRNANSSHVLLDEAARAARGVGLEQTARGGDVTYHGPGQIVGYPIFRIGKEPNRILPYVSAIEDALLRAVAVFGIEAQRDRRNRGIWVGNAKLAAIGVRVSGGVTTHGFAWNVTTDLTYYEGIVPCGLQDAGVTSLAKLLPVAPPMNVVKSAVVEAFAAVFAFPKVYWSSRSDAGPPSVPYLSSVS